MKLEHGWTALAAILALALGACEQERADLETTAKQTVDAAKETMDAAAEKAREASTALGELGEERVAELGRVAAELEKQPERAEAILEAHGLTAEQLEQALYRIAESPALSKIFEEAKKAASAPQG